MSYTVRTIRETGTITYHCSTTRMALDKVEDFRRAKYVNITIAENDDQYILESKLIARLGLAHQEHACA